MLSDIVVSNTPFPLLFCYCDFGPTDSPCYSRVDDLTFSLLLHQYTSYHAYRILLVQSSRICVFLLGTLLKHARFFQLAEFHFSCPKTAFFHFFFACIRIYDKEENWSWLVLQRIKKLFLFSSSSVRDRIAFSSYITTVGIGF